jgi:hypothetical protein
MTKTFTPEVFLRNKIAKQRYAARVIRGITWDIDEDRLVQRVLASNQCQISGRELAYESNYIETVSLDRIDSGIGYIDSNVQWVGSSVNTAKGTLSTADFVEMCADIARHAGYTVYRPHTQIELDLV